MTVRWTALALNHLREIGDYIATDSSAAAQRTVANIVIKTRQLSRFPNSGPIVREHHGHAIQELVEDPYRILYEVRSDGVFVLGVVHGRRNLRSFLRRIRERR